MVVPSGPESWSVLSWSAGMILVSGVPVVDDGHTSCRHRLGCAVLGVHVRNLDLAQVQLPGSGDPGSQPGHTRVVE